MGFKYNPLIYSGFDLTGGAGGAPFFMPPVQSESDLPAGATNGEMRVVLDTDHIYVYNGDTGMWRDTGMTEGTTFGSTPNDIGYDLEVEVQGGIERNVIVLQPADATHPGAVSIVDQEFGGVKTFVDGVNPGNGSNPLKFIGTDAAGVLASIDAWNVDPAVGHITVYTGMEAVDNTYTEVHHIENALESLVNVTGNNTNGLMLDSHFDRNGNGIDNTGGGFNTLRVRNAHEGTGRLDNREGINVQMQIQNGGVSNNAVGIQVNHNIDNGSILDSGNTLRASMSGSGGAQAKNFQHINVFANDIDFVGGNLDGMVVGVGNNVTTDSFTQGYNFFIQPGFTSTNNVMGFSFNDASNALFTTGFNYVHQGTTTNSVDGFRTFTDNTASAAFIRNMSFDTNGTYGQLIGYQVQASPSSVVSGQLQGFHISDQGSSTDFQGLRVDATGTYSNSATGISINMTQGSVNSGLGRALSIAGSGEGINLNSQFTPQSSVFIDQGNVIVSQMIVPNGSPLTGTDVINQNFSSLIFAQDDVAMGPIGIGVVGVGFVGQLAVESGHTVDSVSMSLGGAGIPVQSTGGTVTNLALFDAKGVLAQGGTIQVDNLYGLRVQNNFGGGMSSNVYGVYVEDPGALSRFAGMVEVDSGIAFYDQVASGNRMMIRAANTMTADYTIDLPENVGTSGQVLTTDGTGITSWTTVTGAGDIQETNFSGVNNQVVPADVTDFLFASTVKSFEALVNVQVDATTPLYEHFRLYGVNKGGAWVLYAQSFGDDSGVNFSIASGQIQYTSDNYPGFISLDIDFRALTLNA